MAPSSSIPAIFIAYCDASIAIVTVSSSIEATAFSRFGPDPPPFQTRATSVEGSLWKGMYAPYPLIPTLSLLFITCNYCQICPSHAVDKEVVNYALQKSAFVEVSSQHRCSPGRPLPRAG